MQLDGESVVRDSPHIL